MCFLLDSDVELEMLILVFYKGGCQGERLDKELKELLKEPEEMRKISADLLDLFCCFRRMLKHYEDNLGGYIVNHAIASLE